MRIKHLIITTLVFSACHLQSPNEKQTEKYNDSNVNKCALIILGTVQDAGSPHIACNKDCCKLLFENPNNNRKVVSLGLVDPMNNEAYLFDASPDISSQLKNLKSYRAIGANEMPTAIFLTHAHIGHYTGLMYLGKEAMNAKELDVYAMPRMKSFLETNGPWSQLVSNKNIILHKLNQNNSINLSSNYTITPFTVPHRDEYSETVGYLITGPNKKALFIPDIDKWEKWNKNIINEISNVDYAFIDATFYDGIEINNRDISIIPHPFIIESMQLFDNLSKKEKNKINFIHLNHTNPALNPNSLQAQNIRNKGFNIAQINDVFEL